MKKSNQGNLRILHIGPDPEFLSPVFVDNIQVDISTIDNVFSACQWISENGLPDAVICEQKLTVGNGTGFHDFWIKQFDPELKVPFILLVDEKTPELSAIAFKQKIDDILIRPVSEETLVNRILLINKESMPISGNENFFQATKYKTPLLKRLLDIILASLILLIIWPFLLIFAIAIKLESKGKFYYVSKRVGSGYQLFDFFQLRTMYIHSDKRMKELGHLNQYVKEASTPLSDKTTGDSSNHPGDKESSYMKFESDPRISKVGQFLRKMHFDQLPQLINVIKGDLSIVGNRPLKIYDAELLSPEDLINRMHGPSGITGLWKLKSRRRLNRMSSEERRALDNKYFKIAKRKFSFWSDLWIIARSIPVILRRGNI